MLSSCGSIIPMHSPCPWTCTSIPPFLRSSMRSWLPSGSPPAQPRIDEPDTCRRYHSRHRPNEPESTSTMDPKLLELLVCPVTKGPLTYDRDAQELISRSARLAYPVRDGIPILLENEARTLTDEELERQR